ncbi:helix-turn-helix transcriptional regulator [Pyxidicoccus fallax]|uniref:AraC family transcriptional regulator n=1 Tax=Pyxidicoccus fallax TaxID=394095 RepID=A0A848L6E2_9BACT|nr:AraC family transcriptional regulator [Pyxidicoccus fallax]NMO14530.1 AraC family transcriptional regulator [Pyxidicoccus fallax]NPC77049.1 helix-turn-helix transcriptional regulator [Pyxidicoccus fallax]
MPPEPHSHPSHVASEPWGQRDFERGRFPLWAGRIQRRHQGRGGSSATHSYAVVMLVTRGESKIRHSGELVLHAGDVHLIPPGDAHRSGPADVEGWALAFHPEVLGGAEGEGASRLGPLLRVRQGCHPVLRPTLTQRRRLARWMRLLAEETTRNDRGSEEARISLLRLVLIELERISAPTPVSEPPSVSLSRKALTYIEAHCLEPLSLAKVARELGRSPAHVAGLVRQETGRTVGEWILECRMAEARRRLRGTDERVDIIAERVGYADVTHFIRLFRRVHGVTPAAWRRRVTAPPA